MSIVIFEKCWGPCGIKRKGGQGTLNGIGNSGLSDKNTLCNLFLLIDSFAVSVFLVILVEFEKYKSKYQLMVRRAGLSSFFSTIFFLQVEEGECLRETMDSRIGFLSKIQTGQEANSQTFHCLCRLLDGDNICYLEHNQCDARICQLFNETTKSQKIIVLGIVQYFRNKNTVFRFFLQRKLCDVLLSLKQHLSHATTQCQSQLVLYQEFLLQGVFLTGTPLKVLSTKKVNLG